MSTQKTEKVLPYAAAKRSFEARYVRDLLRRTQVNITAAARLAGKERSDFYDLVRRSGVSLPGLRHAQVLDRAFAKKRGEHA